MTGQLDTFLSAVSLELRSADVPFSAGLFMRHNGQAPSDYLEAFTRYRGWAGDVGKAYLDVWNPEEIREANVNYRVEEFAPGFTIFASDGGNTAYAFERSSGNIYTFPFIGMTMDEPAVFLSPTFEGFLTWLMVQDNN
jgi:hypothetical protein